jgi:Protein of unknown function (DUF1091)
VSLNIRIFLFHQQAYLLFDRLETKSNMKYVNYTMNIFNTPDGQSGVFNQEMKYIKDMDGEQARVKVSIQANPADSQYKHVMFATTIDVCKLFKGVRASPVAKVMMENYEKSFNADLTCKRYKDRVYEVTNCTCSDKFLPPMPVEMKFKFSYALFSSVVGKKALVPVWTFDIFGRMKK